MNINRFGIEQTVRSDAFYAQEQWTLGRMTVQGAMRYDRASSYFPEQTVGPVRFFPTAVTYPRTTGVEGYNDLWPRGGVAYDLFGTGKTSVKVNFGRYLEAAQNGGLFIALNPTGRLSTTTTRAWTDANRQLRGRLQPAELGRSGPARERRRFLWRQREPEFRDGGLRFDVGPGAPVGVGRALGRLAVGRVGAARSAASRRGRSGIPAAVAHQLPSSPTTATGRPGTTRSSASTFPWTARLPDGGGGVLGGLYNVTPTAATRLTDNYQTLASNICAIGRKSPTRST